MKTLATTVLAAALTLGALAGPAAANGDGGAEQRAKLKAALEESRGETSGSSLFDHLFGGDAGVVEGETGTQETN